MNWRNKFLIVIAGPTAVGKTALSIQLAKQYNSPIVSIDSRQIYRELEIGTAKPSPNELKSVTHYFINSQSIFDTYTVGDYETDALQLLDKLFLTHDIIISVGGSGLFVNTLCNGIDDIPEIDPEIREKLNTRFENEGLELLQKELQLADPVYFEKVDKNNPQRIIRALEVCIGTGQPFSSFLKADKKKRPFSIIKIGLELPREILYKRIDERMDIMLEAGLEKEARNFYPHKNLYALQTVGYSELFDYFDNKYDYEQAVFLLKRNSRRYAKRQLTWFKRDKEMKWFSPDEYEEIINYINTESKLKQ